MYLIDTDVVIWVLRGKEEIVECVSKLKEKSPLSISVITISEIYKNIFPAELTRIEEYLSELVSWDVTAQIAKTGGLYWQQYHKKFTKLHLADCLIAATASEQTLKLVTLNTRYFPMSDIDVIKPI